jgi:hypothetical protein
MVQRPLDLSVRCRLAHCRRHSLDPQHIWVNLLLDSLSLSPRYNWLISGLICDWFGLFFQRRAPAPRLPRYIFGFYLAREPLSFDSSLLACPLWLWCISQLISLIIIAVFIHLSLLDP